VLFFGRLREVAGTAEETTDVVEGATLSDLFQQYANRIPALEKFRSSLVASCNQEFAAWDTLIRPADEIAFLPPVSGG
jgi:molybdopterin converting factor subunit 1